MESKLGGTITQQRMEYSLNPAINQYEYTYNEENVDGIFNISKDNNPEDISSAFVTHRNTVIKNTINENLNLAISNYNNGGIYNFQLPILTDNDWETMLENVSILTFVQGIPIGTKYYNNYAIATSKINREYVDPNGIYFSGSDQKYHLPYCVKSVNGVYTGYRSAEYTLKHFSDSIASYEKLYYDHDEQGNNNSELACYYCIVNRENYKSLENDTGDTETDEKIYYQVKAYNEALARERYEQKERIEANIGILIEYNSNMKKTDNITQIIDVNPNQQEIMPDEPAYITTQKPQIVTNDKLIFECLGWSRNKSATEPEFKAGQQVIFGYDDDPDGDGIITLYAVWRIKLESLNWNSDYYWNTTGTSAPNPSPGGSISLIDIIGNNVKMYGNGTYHGKGAAWLNWEYTYMDILEISFRYNIDFGDSFTAAGILLNVQEKNETLTGYMLSFNNKTAWGGVSNDGGKFKNAVTNATLWSFTYEKGNNGNNIEKINWVSDFDIPKTGNIIIRVTNSGYQLTETGSGAVVNVDIPGTVVNRNSMGFFTDHYDHSCSNCGYFFIEDIGLIVKMNDE